MSTGLPPEELTRDIPADFDEAWVCTVHHSTCPVGKKAVTCLWKSLYQSPGANPWTGSIILCPPRTGRVTLWCGIADGKESCFGQRISIGLAPPAELTRDVPAGFDEALVCTGANMWTEPRLVPAKINRSRGPKAIEVMEAPIEGSVWRG